jgi:hypothetical protein
MQDETFFKIFATGVAVSMMFSFLVIFYRYYGKSSDKNFDLTTEYLLTFYNQRNAFIPCLHTCNGN